MTPPETSESAGASRAACSGTPSWWRCSPRSWCCRPLGRRVIVSGDEARFAMLAQDMMKRQSWTDAHVRDRRYRNKPLLYPWAIRVLSMPGGRVTQTTAHLPIALAAIAAVFFTTLLGQQLFGRRAGVWAGLIAATSYGFFAHSQILLPDMIVIAFGLAALAAFWASISHPPGRACWPPSTPHSRSACCQGPDGPAAAGGGPHLDPDRGWLARAPPAGIEGSAPGVPRR